VLIRPGDVVNVARAGIIYVVGEVRKPGGFVLKGSETVTALQALALAEGFTRTSARGQARIIRIEETTGARREIPIDLKKVLAGKLADVPLQPKDVLLVPNSAGRSALYRGLEAAVSVGTGLAIYRR
jgi:polysaccharide export outer membrane protein